VSGTLATPSALLCDADGNLFPSEEPAFVASAEVTNRLLAEVGIARRFTPTELRLGTTGRNFRTTATSLLAAEGVTLPDADLERWVETERREVTEHLRASLTPDPEVTGPLTELARRSVLAIVSSSAHARLGVCLEVTGLAPLFPGERRYSAEDSLPVPTSKPDPAVYVLAAERLRVAPGDALAVEDSVPGAHSAVAAGVPTVGNLQFVPPAERAARADALRAAGVAAVVGSWREFSGLLS
jgi:beta-phosphoglucomutase-like phosphatase (HAD superfamily)